MYNWNNSIKRYVKKRWLRNRLIKGSYMIQVCAYLLIFQSSLFLFSHVWSINEKWSQIHFQSLWRHVALNRKHHKKGHFLRSSQLYYSWWSLFMKSDRHPPNAGSVLCMALISSSFFLVTNFDKWKYRLTFSLWNEQFHLGLLEKNWTISFLESLSTQTELFTEEGPLIC